MGGKGLILFTRQMWRVFKGVLIRHKLDAMKKCPLWIQRYTSYFKICMKILQQQQRRLLIVTICIFWIFRLHYQLCLQLPCRKRPANSGVTHCNFLSKCGLFRAALNWVNTIIYRHLTENEQENQFWEIEGY